jgi:predicted transcriptional regulator
MRRKAAAREIPPPLELECLKALWTLGEGNVKQVRAWLAPNRPLAYTTVMTLLDRLSRKGAASRRKTGRFFVYSPSLERDTLRRLALNELINGYFDGSRDALVTYLAGSPLDAQPAAAITEERLDTALL